MTIEVEDKEPTEDQREVVTAAIGGRVFIMREGCVEAVEIVPVGNKSGMAYLHLFTDAGHQHKYVGPVSFDQARKIARFFLVEEVKSWSEDPAEEDVISLLEDEDPS